MNQFLKCGITNQIIEHETVQLLMITAEEKNSQVWDNSDGHAISLPFHPCALKGFFAPVSLPISGNFNSELEFQVENNTSNVIAVFSILRGLYHKEGFQNGHFNIQNLLNNFPTIKECFNYGNYNVEELFTFTAWHEFKTFVKTLITNVLFNKVPFFNEVFGQTSQAHVMVVMDCVYQNLATAQLPECKHIIPQGKQKEYQSSFSYIQHIFKQINDVVLDESNTVYFNKVFNTFTNMKYCQIDFKTATYGSEDGNNFAGYFMKELVYKAYMSK